MTHDQQIQSLKQQIVEQYEPEQIFLFGSCAKGIPRGNSDIDLCIIKNVQNPRQFKIDLQLNLRSEASLDIVIYSPKNWARFSEDSGSFAYLIKNRGVLLYG
ncbi:MAG TPA: nucleotidyltransferase [Firmicutes bacterium]|jgi:uncharacterized protein|nr:nucleotidyltransferase [Bacillota bacterium]